MELVTNGRRTLVATMHDVDLALRLFPRIIGLREGRIVFDQSAVNVDREAIAALYAGEQLVNPTSLEPKDWFAVKSQANREPSCPR
jgi:phosphonate transport system ATP-binding protein